MFYNHQRLLPFNTAKRFINDGDVLLFRGSGLGSKLIKIASRGPYSHAGLVYRDNNILKTAEFREWKGCLSQGLYGQVLKYPNQIDVFRISKKAEVFSLTNEVQPAVISDWISYKPQKAVGFILELSGLPYGWKRIWYMSLQFVPILRLFFKPSFKDRSEDKDLYPVCSTVVASAIRKAFVDLVPNLSDYEVTPSDLARSPLMHYLCTLTP
jgi:hypothetical protein